MTHINRNIAIRLADHNDEKQWDAYVLSHPDSSPYHLFAWKSAIEEAYGHSCYYLCGEEKGNFVGVLPLVHIRFPGIVNELSALPYCDIGNCLCDSDPVQDALLGKAVDLHKELGSKKLSLRGQLKETNLKSGLFQVEDTGKVRMLLELPSTSNDLFTGFKSKLRSQIHKAQKNGISFVWGGMEDLDDIYTVFSKNMHDLGSPVHAKGWLKCIMTHYSQRVKVGLARFEDKTVGMGVILLGRDSVSIPWASTLREYNHLGPNMLLYWRLLEFSVENGFKCFDFGRSTEHEGTYKFKKQWGAEPKPLVWYALGKANNIRSSSPSLTKSLISAFWRKTPLVVANTFGPGLRKFISL